MSFDNMVINLNPYVVVTLREEVHAFRKHIGQNLPYFAYHPHLYEHLV